MQFANKKLFLLMNFIQKVSSFAGNETRSAKLSVIELPFAPSNVQANRLKEPNQRTVNLSWTPGFDGNSPILKYIVQRREVSEIGTINQLNSKNITKIF